MIKITNCFFSAVFFTFIFLSNCAHANIWRVNNKPTYTQGCNHCFSSLQEANDTSLVLPGDTIHLEGSNLAYSGSGFQNATLITKPMVIIGPGYLLDENPGFQKSNKAAMIKRIEFLPNSENSKLIGVRVYDPGGYDQLQIKTDNITIESCFINTEIAINPSVNSLNNIIISKCFVGDRIFRSAGSMDITNLIIKNTCILGTLQLGNSTFVTEGEVYNCIIRGLTNLAPIEIFSGISSFYNNIVSASINENDNGSNIFSNIFIPSMPSWANSTNGIALPFSIVFPTIGTTEGKLNVNPPSICPDCYSGYPSGNQTIGIFGGLDPYRSGGIPKIPSIYELVTPTEIILGTPINVNVSTRSNE